MAKNKNKYIKLGKVTTDVILHKTIIDTFNRINIIELPNSKVNKGKQLVNWGDTNNYPNFLIDLYNTKGGSRHKSIIDKKVNFIIGQGFEDIIDPRLKEFIEENELNEQLESIALDLEVFGGFALEVIWSIDQTSISKITWKPISQLRFGLINDINHREYLWYSRDWTNTRHYVPEPIHLYDENFPEGKQIYYFSKAALGNVLNPYPIPGYSSAIESIMTDGKIDRFHLADIVNGYTPGYHVNFVGIPTKEERDANRKLLDANLKGENNANRSIITYSESKEDAPTYTMMNGNDNDRRFVDLDKRIEKQIVLSSGIPPQLLVSSNGIFGDDRITLLNEFQKSYVSPKQNTIERILNKILLVNNYSQKLTLKKYQE